MVFDDDIRVHVIGQVGVSVPDSGFKRLQPAQRQMLSLLVAAGPSGLTTDQIADEIWPEQLPNQWQSAVRMTVSRLRRSCECNIIEMVDGYYRLTVEPNQVDAWALRELADRPSGLTGIDATYLGELIGSTELHGGVYGTITIESSARELEDGQRSLISHSAAQQIRLPLPVLRSLHRRVMGAPWDEELCLHVAELHMVAGLLDSARDLIVQTKQELNDSFGVPPSEALLALEQRLDDGTASQTSERGDVADSDPVVLLPPALQPTPDRPDVRPEAAAHLASLIGGTESSTVILLGPAGSASQNLIGHALSTLGADAGLVLHGRCSDGVSNFEPFVQMLPTFRALLARDLLGAEAHSGSADRSALWSAVAEELGERSGGRPITVVVASAHFVDSASSDLLIFLARSTHSFPLRIIVTGVSEMERPEFARLQGQLATTANAHTVLIEPLDLDQIDRLISYRFPDVSSALLRSLASELQGRSGGLPTVVDALLDLVDPQTMRLPPSGGGQSIDVFTQLVGNLSSAARSVAVAAAVIGMDASLNDLQQMCDLDPDELLDVVDELLDTGLIVETAGVDRLSFAHQLAMDVFLQQARSFRIRQMHMKARNLTSDPHRRARHDLLAHPSVPSAEARISQLRSARILHSQRSFREAAAAFRNAQSLQPDVPLGTSDAVGYADSISRTGALGEAAVLRSEVISRCIADGDWDGVLSAATVGLPEAELIDGDPERFAQLSSIPADRLSRDRRFELALHLARQASLLGRTEVARVWVQRAEEAAISDSERVAATLAWRLSADVAVPATDRLSRLNTALKLEVPDNERLPLLQVAAIDRYQTGDIEEALDLNRQFGELAEREQNPLRIWHSRLFDSMSAFDAGAWDRATALADEALNDGQRYGVTVAAPTRMAQEFWLYWMRGAEAELVDLFDAVPPDDASSVLFQSGHSVSLFAAGDTRRAQNKAVRLTQQFLDAPQAHGLSSTVLLAPVLASTGDERLISSVVSHLERHADTAMLVGAGIVNLGPVQRALIQLGGGGSLEDAQSIVAICDRLHSPSWRARSRIELRERVAEAGGDTTGIDAELTTITTGTSFVAWLG